jgi:hypothetical protein
MGGFLLNRNIVSQIALGASLLALATLRPALAADDEIMVTDGDLAKVGTPELEVHINFSRGSNQSPGEGVFAPNDVLRVTPELSIGLSEHWDTGLYVLTSWVPGYGLYYGGIKARAKYINTHPLADDAHWYYGVQFEVADVNAGVSPDRTSVEVKAIGGVEVSGWEAALNVVEQRDVPDHDLISPGYAVNAKLVRNLANGMAVGVEQYITWSSTALEEPIREIDKLSFLTLQWKVRDWSLQLGIGHGWSNSPDRTIVKLVVGVPIG